MDGGAWWTIVHRVAKSRTRLNYFTFTFTLEDSKAQPWTYDLSCVPGCACL